MNRITSTIRRSLTYPNRVSLNAPTLDSEPQCTLSDSFDLIHDNTAPVLLDAPLSHPRTNRSDSPTEEPGKRLDLLPSLGSDNGLQDLEHRINKVTNCLGVEYEDSTTGAHVAMDEDGNSIFIVKSNNECHFELLGNCIAEMLQLNIPDFVLLGHDISQQQRLKGMLRSRDQFPCLITEFRCAINLKEVNPGSLLDTDTLFHQLGRVFLMDLAIGNWDRFPVFESDTHGNYGNVMYEPELKRLLFIDTVAQKHTEASGEYGTDHYLDLSNERLSSACIRIKSWLKLRFSHLESLNSTKTIDEFKAGVDDALKILIANEKEISDLFFILQCQIEVSHTKIAQKLSNTIETLGETISLHLEQLRIQTQGINPTNLQDVLLAIKQDEYFTDKEKVDLFDRLSKGRGIPRIGDLAAKTVNNKSFMAMWNNYSTDSHQLESIEKLKKLDVLLKNKRSPNSEVLIDGLRATTFNNPILNTLIHLHAIENELQMQHHKLSSLIDVFKKLTQEPNALRHNHQTQSKNLYSLTWTEKNN